MALSEDTAIYRAAYRYDLGQRITNTLLLLRNW